MAKNLQCNCLCKRPFQARNSQIPEETALSPLQKPRKRRRAAESTAKKATLRPKIEYIASATTSDVIAARNQALFQASYKEKASIPKITSPHVQFCPSKASIPNIILKDMAIDILQVCSSGRLMSMEDIMAELGQKRTWSGCKVANLAKQVSLITRICLAVGVIGKRGDCLCLQKSGNCLLEAKIAQKKATLTHLCEQFMAIQQLIRRNFTTPASSWDSLSLPLLLLATGDSPDHNLRISEDPDGCGLSVKGRLPFKLLSEGDVLRQLDLPRCSAALTAQLLPHPDLQLYLPK